jgi:uncharacterized membrane protein
MSLDMNFITKMLDEVRTWTQSGIIAPEQLKQIEALYLPQSTASENKTDTPKGRPAINIVAVILGLAGLCLSVGIIIFYASNWRAMPPLAKLIQVFLLIIATYGGAWFLLFVLEKYLVLGRVLLVIGMVTYGVGIMLVAQIYHISAHPTHGMLAWAIGVLVMSVIMKERFGLYLATLLFFIWNTWEYFQFDNPAYLYALFIAVPGFFYWRMKDMIGCTVSVILALWFFFQLAVTHTMINNMNGDDMILFILIFLPLGALMITGGMLLTRTMLWKPAGYLLLVAGWILYIIPFVGISWPFGSFEMPVIASFANPRYAIQYCATFVACVGLIALLFRKKEPVTIALSLALFPLAALFIPFGNTTARMVSTHLCMVGLIIAFLFFSYRTKGYDTIIRGFAFTFAFSIIIAKGIGFITYSTIDRQYALAYLCGYIIIVIVCFLANMLISHLLERKKLSYPGAIMHSLCAAMLWITVYAASFRIEEQKSILTADRIVIIMTVLFSIIAVALFAALLSILRGKKILVYLTGVVFVTAIVSMFTAGPDMSWIVYSLLFNALLLAISATYIWYSTIIQSKVLLNIMVIAFVILIFTRYFDLFWDMLSGSVLFITTGVIGLAGGFLIEWKRRSLVKRMKGNK